MVTNQLSFCFLPFRKQMRMHPKKTKSLHFTYRTAAAQALSISSLSSRAISWTNAVCTPLAPVSWAVINHGAYSHIRFFSRATSDRNWITVHTLSAKMFNLNFRCCCITSSNVLRISWRINKHCWCTRGKTIHPSLRYKVKRAIESDSWNSGLSFCRRYKHIES